MDERTGAQAAPSAEAGAEVEGWPQPPWIDAFLDVARPRDEVYARCRDAALIARLVARLARSADDADVTPLPMRADPQLVDESPGECTLWRIADLRSPFPVIGVFLRARERGTAVRVVASLAPYGDDVISRQTWQSLLTFALDDLRACLERHDDEPRASAAG